MATDVESAVRKLISVNPATEEVLCEFDAAQEGEIRKKVAQARAAQPAWFGLGTRERLARARSFQQLLYRRKAAVADLITREAGKPYVESLSTEIAVVLDSVRFLIENGCRILQAEPVHHGSVAMKAKRGRIVREPYGVIGIISPWNYPFSIPATQALAALVAGNCVVLKPSEFTSLVALQLAELLYQAGFPHGVFQVAVGDKVTGQALLEAEIDKLIFTGSVATGRSIGEAAATRFLPVTLELGGKDPMIVLDDANINVASSGAVWGAFVNAGQACLS
ncbi:MAG: aldehyde dehydrogenase family protein, partial [Acidobacteria bacterium]|nr:aldehyde dehydrogenase family protein [Acidobacteriota bacterium]